MQNKGFTLIELLIVVVIVGILALAAIPLIASNTEEARSSEARAALGAMKDRARVVYQRTPADEAVADAGDAAAQGPRLGLSLRPLQPQEKSQAKLDGGMVVEQVTGAAERAGIEAGDVLLAINGKPVNSIEQIRGVLKSQPKSVALLVQRQGNQIFVPVPLS